MDELLNIAIFFGTTGALILFMMNSVGKRNYTLKAISAILIIVGVNYFFFGSIFMSTIEEINILPEDNIGKVVEFRIVDTFEEEMQEREEIYSNISISNSSNEIYITENSEFYEFEIGDLG